MKPAARFESLFPHVERLYYALQRVYDPATFDRWNRDHLLFRNRLEDMAIVWARMRREFRKLRGRRVATLTIRDFHSRWRLAWQLRLDMEIFYVYANLLLNKFVLVARPTLGTSARGIQVRSFRSFADSLRQQNTILEPLAGFRNRFMSSIDRLEARVCFYRDKFVMHPQSPYQESVHLEPTRGLVVIRRRREDLDARRTEEATQLQELLGKAVAGLKSASGAHAIAQAIFDNLHLVPAGHRQRAESLVQAVGVDSPPLFGLAKEIVTFLRDSLDYIADMAARRRQSAQSCEPRGGASERGGERLERR